MIVGGEQYMKIAISVIIPVYNVENYLEQCLESVVNQSVPFDEVILVNDGSTDDSPLICERYLTNYKYIKLINQENKGPSIARNVGIEQAVSDYIMFLDADDYLEINTVETLKDDLLKAEYDAIFFDAAIHVEDHCDYPANGNEYDRKDANLDGMKMTGIEYFYQCYPKWFVASACMAIYNKKWIEMEGIKFPEGMFYEDTYFTFAATMKARRVEHISKKLYQRRYRNSSTMTSKYTKARFRDHIKIGLLLWNEIMNNQELWIYTYRMSFLYFVNDFLSMIIGKYRLCKDDNGKADKDVRMYFENIVNQYLSVIDKLYMGDMFKDIPLLSRLMHNFHDLYLEEIITDRMCIKTKIKEIAAKQKNNYTDVLSGLPLGKEKLLIGIYGTGNHTEGLLAVFEKIFGEISCNLVFIDSSADKRMYRNKKVINYKKIDSNFDLIIISSFLYEDEMVRNVRSIRSDISIYTFYKHWRDDIFSDYRIFMKYC